MKMQIRNILAALLVLGLPCLPTAYSAEIPPGLDRMGRIPGKSDGTAILQPSGFPAEEPGAEAEALDPVELTELAHSDPSQQGGGIISAVAIVAAILILILLL